MLNKRHPTQYLLCKKDTKYCRDLIYCMLILYSFIRYFIRKDKYAHERGEVFPETNAHVWMNAESAEKNKSEISSGEFA